MKNARKLSVLLVLAALGAGAQAQSDTSRTEVQADLLQAIRAGNVTVGGEAGLTARNCTRPVCLPRRGGQPADARRSEVASRPSLAAGELAVQGEAGLYPRANLVPTGIAVAANHPARAVVKAETWPPSAVVMCWWAANPA